MNNTKDLPVSQTADDHPIKIGVCTVNSPIYVKNDAIFIDRNIRTLEPLCDHLFVITGNFTTQYGENVHIIEIERGKLPGSGQSVLRRVSHQLATQLKLTRSLLSIRKKVTLVFFDIGEYRNLLPILASKLMGKKTIIYHRGGDKMHESKLMYSSGVKKVIPLIESFLFNTSYSIADGILCESPSIIKVGKLEKYQNKITIWGGYYIDVKRFRIIESQAQRLNLIGYSGRLSPVKGLVNLIRAIPIVIKERPEMKFVIAGSGEEQEKIEAEIKTLGLQSVVTLKSWIPDDEFPDYLNQLKLFILPSYEEGIPTVIREAMACGAIVLTTPVGGIPDIVHDGNTGFIMENNTPECISRNIIRVLKSPDLERIASDARALVEKESSFEAAQERWKGILGKLNSLKI